ncbi:MAG: hypothetical protein WAP03_15045 [Methylorubrum rhodinum]
MAAIRDHPSDVVAHAGATAFEAASVLVEALMDVGDRRTRIGEEAHVVVGRGAVALERQQTVAAPGHDGLGDGGSGAHRVEGDEGAPEFEPLRTAGDGGDLLALVGDRLLAEHEALTAAQAVKPALKRSASSASRVSWAGRPHA